MKKLILSALAAVAFTTASAGTFTVYNNGALGENITVYGWWNAGMNFQAANPAGTNQVFKFTSADGTPAASMGLNLEKPGNTGPLHSATLNFKWYAEGGGTYAIRLTSVKSQDYTFCEASSPRGQWNSVSLVVSDVFPEVATQWNDNTNFGVGYVFSLVLEGAEAGSAIYIDNVEYTNTDDAWVEPEVEVFAPTSVPVPTQDAADVLSLFSTKYPQAINWNPGYWGQTTSPEENQIDGQKVYYMRNFNYQGWEFAGTLDVSDCDYLHLDLWTHTATAFGFTPISQGPKEKAWIAPTVTTDEWNSYDVPLSYFSEVVDLASLFQFKMDQGTGADLYVANVYFYKDKSGSNPGGGDEPGNNNPGNTFSGTTSATLPNCKIDGNTQDFNVTYNYSVTYNENGTLTIKMNPVQSDFNKIVGIVPQLFFDGAYKANLQSDGQGGWTFTTADTYSAGTTIAMSIYSAYDGGAGNSDSFNYVVGSSSETETGVNAIATEEGEAVYFTVNGMKADSRNLNPGLYIRVINGKASKVIVR